MSKNDESRMKDGTKYFESLKSPLNELEDKRVTLRKAREKAKADKVKASRSQKK